MWYLSSPEKSVTPGINPDGGGVEVMWGSNVRVEPGPAIFYLTSAAAVVGNNGDDETSLKEEEEVEDELLGSAPFCGGGNLTMSLTSPPDGTAQGSFLDDYLAQEFILPDIDPSMEMKAENDWEPVADEEIPLDISCSLEDLKTLAAKLEVPIPGTEDLPALSASPAAPAPITPATPAANGKRPSLLRQDAGGGGSGKKAKKGAGTKTCKFCHETLTESNADEVIGHIVRKHSALKKFPCCFCESVLSSESGIKKHVRNVHFRLEAFECPVCKKAIQQRSHLKEHIQNVHGGKRALKAVLTNAKAFANANPDFYQRALNAAVPVQGIVPIKEQAEAAAAAAANGGGDIMAMNEVLKCVECSILLTSKLHFVWHVKDSHKGALPAAAAADTHPPPSAKSVLTQRQTNIISTPSFPTAPVPTAASANTKCKVCGIDCADLESKRRHVATSHNYMTSLKCKFCTKTCHSEAHFEAHMRHFHPTSPHVVTGAGDVIKCNWCDDVILDKTDKLLTHAADCHPYQCAECPKHFRKNGGESLEDHYLQVHVKDLELLDVENEFVDVESTATRAISNNSSGAVSYMETGAAASAHQPPPQPLVKGRSPSLKKGRPLAAMQQENNGQPRPLIEDNKVMDQLVLDGVKREIQALVLNNASVPNNGGKLPCEYCRSTEQYDTPEQLIKHVVSEHPYRCMHCPNRMFKLARSVQKHFRNFHKKYTPYFCKVCTAVFNDASSQEQHCTQLSHFAPSSTENAAAAANSSFNTSSLDISTSSSCSSASFYQQQPTSKRNGGANDFSGKAKLGQGVCTVCFKDFGELKALSEHVLEAHDYTCEVCNKQYKLSDSIRKHCKKEHSDYFEEPVVCCRFCPSVFRNIPSKRAHIAKVHGLVINKLKNSTTANENGGGGKSTAANGGNNKKFAYRCPVCKKGYNYADSIRKHARTHGLAGIGICSECNQVLPSLKAKAKHMAKVHNRTVLQKPKKPSQFTNGQVPAINGSSLAEKDKQPGASTGGNSSYECPKCGKRYDHPSSVRKHCNKYHGFSVRFCSTCTKVFRNNRLRDAHVNEGCAGVVGLVQPLAQQTLQQPSPVKIPITAKSAQTGSTANKCFQCQIPVAFSNRADLEDHRFRIHPFACPVCRNNYPDKAIRRHMIDEHGRHEVFLCGECHSVFDSVQEQAVHSDGNCRVENRKREEEAKAATQKAVVMALKGQRPITSFYTPTLSHEDVTIPQPLITATAALPPVALPEAVSFPPLDPAAVDSEGFLVARSISPGEFHGFATDSNLVLN